MLKQTHTREGPLLASLEHLEEAINEACAGTCVRRCAVWVVLVWAFVTAAFRGLPPKMLLLTVKPSLAQASRLAQG